jgi:hypothetical protein
MAAAGASKKSPDIAVLIAAGVAVVALVAWLASWWAFSSDDEATQLTRVEKAQTATSKAQQQAHVDAPVAAPPPVETTIAPQHGESWPAAPEAAKDEPSASARAAPHEAPARAREARSDPAQDRARAEAAVKPQVSAPPEGSAPKKPPVNIATRAASESARGAPDPALEAMRGRYTGNYFDSSGSSTEMIGLTLIISSVENGVVKATATLGGRGCHGEYPMQGTYQNKTLNLRATPKGGPAGDCPLNLALAVEGDRLAGAADNGDKVQLKR